MNRQFRVEDLQKKLAELERKQELFHIEIHQIRSELEKLETKPEAESEAGISDSSAQSKVPESYSRNTEATHESEKVNDTGPGISSGNLNPERPEVKKKTDIERFIGENLINKIGIAVTVIGVGIGAKYAIDHRLISPLARIIMGYLVGLGLLFFAVWLKKQYENFSAVLMSGSLAIMYFITYAAYSLYGFYPQLVSFILMVIFTVFTVLVALSYNREIIAVIGMVGAFAVPYLLNEGSENVIVFFSYVAIINTGIMIIAIKKYWKSLYFSAFGFTWLIYLTWLMRSYAPDKDSSLALVSLLVFFVIFYLTFLAYKIVRKDKFLLFDILLLLSNSFIFYGAGYYIINNHIPDNEKISLFTLGNAFIHLIVSAFIYLNRKADLNLFYFVSGLVVVFLTIAVPVQFNGNWVTLLWICEAALLFSIGRIRGATVYENISYPLIFISFISLLEDWSKLKGSSGNSTVSADFIPVWNIQFLSSLIFIAALSVIILIYFSKRYPSQLSDKTSSLTLLNHILPGLLIFVLFFSFWNEISAYFDHLINLLKAEVPDSSPKASAYLIDINNFRMIWLCNYSLFFVAVLSFVNTMRIKNMTLGVVVFWLSFLTIFVFLVQSLYGLSELRDSYLNQTQSGFYILIRYLSFAFVAFSLVSLKLWTKKEAPDNYYRIFFSLLFHLVILWVLCSEMLNILDLLKNTRSYKFGLSILAGTYALILIVIGINGKKRYLRIAAITLLGVTLAKLFFYDITRLDTVLKTILFLILGIVMLLVSFLYNKYNIRLFGETVEKSENEIAGR